MAQKVLDRVYDQTSTAAGSLTASINTEHVAALIIVEVAAGAAAPTNTTVNLADLITGQPAGTAGIPAPGVLQATLTAPAIGGSAVYQIGYHLPGTNSTVPVSGTYGAFLGRQTIISVTGGAASTVRLIIYAVMTV